MSYRNFPFGEIEKLSTFAGVVRNQTLDNPRIKKLSLLERDPPIVLRILRIANSHFYNKRRQVGNVREAVELLGEPLVKSLTYGAPIFTLWNGNRAPKKVVDIWTHAQLSSVAARLIAWKMGDALTTSADTLATAALLHDFGKFVFLSREPGRYSRLLESNDNFESLCAAELSLFGRTHPEEGKRMAELWGLPLFFELACGHHRNGRVREEFKKDLEIVKLSCSLAQGEQCDSNNFVRGSTLEEVAERLGEMKQSIVHFYDNVCGP